MQTTRYLNASSVQSVQWIRADRLYVDRFILRVLSQFRPFDSIQARRVPALGVLYRYLRSLFLSLPEARTFLSKRCTRPSSPRRAYMHACGEAMNPEASRRHLSLLIANHSPYQSPTAIVTMLYKATLYFAAICWALWLPDATTRDWKRARARDIFQLSSQHAPRNPSDRGIEWKKMFAKYKHKGDGVSLPRNIMDNRCTVQNEGNFLRNVKNI